MHALGVAIGAYLKSVGCPVGVVDGPELTTSTTTARERVVIEHQADTFGPPLSQHKNPPHAFLHTLGGKITIYAQSTHAGATQDEHIARAHAILAPVLVGLRVATRMRKVPLAVKSGQLVPTADLAKGEQPGAKGAKYELLFSVGSAITVTTFAGEKAPEAELTAIGSTTEVSLANAPEDAPPPAVACGGE